MRLDKILPRFEELVQRLDRLPMIEVGSGLEWHRSRGFRTTGKKMVYDESGTQEWATEAGAALAAVFPAGHICRQEWDRLITSKSRAADQMPLLIGVFKGAANLVRSGWVSTLADAVRAETESELLDQAEALLEKGYTAAATVIAGGALETHLRHYCDRHSLTWQGDGSISAYDSVVSQTRKSDPTKLYGISDTKLITAWGGFRNDAAHSPGTFQRSEADVRRMIEGIRDFLARTS